MAYDFEILAPGGDSESIVSAIMAGAGAVYCGLAKFNARNSATNISFRELQRVLPLAHQKNCKIFITLNILILEYEIETLIRWLNELSLIPIDGVIVQDLGLLYILKKYFQNMEVHASTQMNTHNEGQIIFLKKLGVKRVNFSRELNLPEINFLAKAADLLKIETEVFVHGSYCLGFSGLCYMSSAIDGNSGNRGRCSQPCRDQYQSTAQGKNYPLNLKDNSAFFDLKELAAAGITALKIEGRIKSADYVHTVVKSWRNQIDSFREKGTLLQDNSELYKVFNRDFTNGYLTENIGSNMFIDNPRNYSLDYFSGKVEGKNEQDLASYLQTLEDERKSLHGYLEKERKAFSLMKKPLSISIHGTVGSYLKVEVRSPEKYFDIVSKKPLEKSTRFTLDQKNIEKRFSSLGNDEYFFKELNLENLSDNLYIPFSELTAIRNEIAEKLTGFQKMVKEVVLPLLNQKPIGKINPKLSVLISEEIDLEVLGKNVQVYFQIPECFGPVWKELVRLFLKNKNLVPWIPEILIGDNLKLAIKFLKEVDPKWVVTNNLGIVATCNELKIDWVAGPFLNMVNSYSLKCLKEEFACSGAFISSELNKKQIELIKVPENFELHYSLYQPISMMESRQCLYLNTGGCYKESVNAKCLPDCRRLEVITNLKKESFVIDKQPGNYNKIYGEFHFMNLEIINDLPNLFCGFMIDLRNIKTKTKIEKNKNELVQYFKQILQRKIDNIALSPTTNQQYQKGL